MIWISLTLSIIQVILGFCCVVYVLWSLSWMPKKNSVPYLPTKSDIVPYVIEALQLKPGSIMYDLGSGDGKIIFACNKVHPDVTYIGIELHIFPYLIARILHILYKSPKNITFIYGNIFKRDFRDATHIYMFLTSTVINILLPQLEQQLKQGTKVVSCHFKFNTKEPVKVIEPDDMKGKFSKRLSIYEF